jgi:tetratricopeptide (TPR) repeat protein
MTPGIISLGSAWKGCAAFIFIAAFAASEVSGQTGQRYAAGEVKSDSGSASIPIDVLRHPINGKVRKMLLIAMDKSDAGEHAPAIETLQATLAKFPDSAPYVQNLLGVEYVKTNQLQAAIGSFEQAVSLMPNVAMTHYNFGLALVCAGDYARAEREVRRALELDPRNSQMLASLNALIAHNRSGD